MPLAEPNKSAIIDKTFIKRTTTLKKQKNKKDLTFDKVEEKPIKLLNEKPIKLVNEKPIKLANEKSVMCKWLGVL
jgi:hypothetical protein